MTTRTEVTCHVCSKTETTWVFPTFPPGCEIESPDAATSWTCLSCRTEEPDYDGPESAWISCFDCGTLFWIEKATNCVHHDLEMAEMYCPDCWDGCLDDNGYDSCQDCVD